MTTLFTESNEKLAIKQIEFGLESGKLELEFHAQAKATQLAIVKMLGDILHAFK
jgi:hypothetical protein